MSRKISIRVPDRLWAALIAKAGGRSISSVILEALSISKAALSQKQSRFWLWAVVVLAVGLALLYLSSVVNRKRGREPESQEF